MARGNSAQTQVFYKGSTDVTFTIFVESEELVTEWKNDPSIPLSQVVAGWTILVPEHDKRGILKTASNMQLEEEFGTSNEDEIVKKVLQQGSIQTRSDTERIGVTNESQGPRTAH
ncbi:hypothetical protein DPSP01_014392 [Paraphaeosphaeria sporulosa]|uniref:DUF1960-domain-containing protein n=1 Tax=Paraphaeosphaeria sporulosa TaxID=1460663 RepID=A0A177CV27_9PLEO|nr:DUF1960-domain-containing protein [Paraphaeosphaeria sporulosa]OAG11096.1 DUF1960-domain-containing protein [Paraphaeosphaeria sporulosa]